MDKQRMEEALMNAINALLAIKDSVSEDERPTRFQPAQSPSVGDVDYDDLEDDIDLEDIEQSSTKKSGSGF